jgi:hypothetical protein
MMVPVCREAMSRGVKVISFDFGVAPEGLVPRADKEPMTKTATDPSECVADALRGASGVIRRGIRTPFSG